MYYTDLLHNHFLLFLDRFHGSDLKSANPLILHAALTASILDIFGQSSNSITRWILDIQTITIELSTTHGILPTKSPIRQILPEEAATLKKIPSSATTTFRWLKLDPVLKYLNCCSSCFAMYPENSAPSRCHHHIANIPGGPLDSTDPNDNTCCPTSEDKEPDLSESICGEPLFKYVHGVQKPARRYAFQSLSDWISRLLSRPEIEKELEVSASESSKPFDPTANIRDIYQSRLWKEFCGPDGIQFTSNSSNLTFALFVDAINPFGNKQSGHHTSITFVILVCLSLPPNLRHQSENVFVVGIAPGPREPSLEQINWILRPLVTELQVLWSTGLLISQTHEYQEGRLIRAALLVFVADIPSLRRCLGFPSATANFFCSFCLLKKSEINNFDQDSWEPRTWCQHDKWACEARDAKTVEERKKIFKTHGVRYSVLIELKYWNIIDFHVVDSMHNLLLGLSSWHVRRFWAMKDLQNDEEKLPPISTVELLKLAAEHSEPLPHRPKSPALDSERDPEELDRNINDMEFSNDTSSSDQEFNPFDDAGWNGEWNPPPLDEIILDSKVLRHINSMLPKIHTPTWIKRPIPVLGKALFGKLKADEWRSLITFQLPLVLIPMWSGKNHIKTSLLTNFMHLVSVVNLGLKRVINSTHIEAYRYHIQKYLESSVSLFQHCKLAPNHHISVHLADCLEKFGPVRAWWSFPYERLMGKILKTEHNNHISKQGLDSLFRFHNRAPLTTLSLHIQQLSLKSHF